VRSWRRLIAQRWTLRELGSSDASPETLRLTSWYVTRRWRPQNPSNPTLARRAAAPNWRRFTRAHGRTRRHEPQVPKASLVSLAVGVRGQRAGRLLRRTVPPIRVSPSPEDDSLLRRLRGMEPVSVVAKGQGRSALGESCARRPGGVDGRAVCT